jgi:hypothetical protein
MKISQFPLQYQEKGAQQPPFALSEIIVGCMLLKFGGYCLMRIVWL